MEVHVIADYSEVTSKLSSKVSALNQALNDKQYFNARVICNEITNDMEDLWQWSMKKDEENEIPKG